MVCILTGVAILAHGSVVLSCDFVSCDYNNYYAERDYFANETHHIQNLQMRSIIYKLDPTYINETHI